MSFAEKYVSFWIFLVCHFLEYCFHSAIWKLIFLHFSRILICILYFLELWKQVHLLAPKGIGSVCTLQRGNKWTTNSVLVKIHKIFANLLLLAKSSFSVMILFYGRGDWLIDIRAVPLVAAGNDGFFCLATGSSSSAVSLQRDHPLFCQLDLI